MSRLHRGTHKENHFKTHKKTKPFLSLFNISILAVLISIAFSTGAVYAESQTFSILKANSRGIVKPGDGDASAINSFDEEAGKNVIQFDYSVPSNSVIGVWAESFSPDLKPNTANAVKIGVKVPNEEQLKQISLVLDITGSRDKQSIPLNLKLGWNVIEEPVRWNKIGELKDIAFVVHPIGDEKSVKGVLYLDLEFCKIDLSKKYIAAIDPKESQVRHNFNIMEARDRDVFNIGIGLGGVFSTFDRKINKEVLQFDYSLHQGSIVGVWTNHYPLGIRPDTIDAVKIGVNVPHPEQLQQVSVKVELKGDTGKQSIQAKLSSGWRFSREAINWNEIGNLQEVVFVVSSVISDPRGANPIDSGPEDVISANVNKQSEGTLYFDLDFYQLTFFQKNFIVIKVSLILIVSLLTALLSVFVGKLFVRIRSSDKLKILAYRSKAYHFYEHSILSGLKRDFLYGIAAVLLVIAAISIYSMGTVSPLEAGFSLTFLVVGLLGALIAEVFKFGFTGKHLTPGEIFKNVLITGLLAASSSRLGVLQAPSTWIALLTLNRIIAVLALLVYHLFNARSLSLSGKHMRTITGAAIIGIPYLFNWLFLLQNSALLQSFINTMTGGLLAAWPIILQTIGRLIIVFGFNEGVTNIISLVSKGRVLKETKAHIFIFFVSLGVVVAPLIADFGSGAAVASMSGILGTLVIIITTMLSFAGLWGEVYLLTGMALDAGHRTEPSWETISNHVITGMKKGLAYSGILMSFLYALQFLLDAKILHHIMSTLPIAVGILSGGLLFPLLKTIIETFDGSIPFFQRARHNYRDITLCARGAIAGFGFAYAVTNGLFHKGMSERIIFGLTIGFLSSAGVSLLRDIIYSIRGQGKIQTWRLYFTDALLGMFMGSALAFYLDSLQVPVVIEKFKLYTSTDFKAREFITYPLVNKWGRIDLGSYAGGAKLLFTESLAGVINWSIAAWLFAINKVFLMAIFEKHMAPIKLFFSKEGFSQLVEHMIYVLRWGLWMSPIIWTFLRMMPEPTWYNQDGAIRTLFAIYHDATMSPEAFKAWSLNVFVYILAFDFFRVLIWMDHMGLRVATLVNLSFVGLDKLDEKIARFIGSASAQRYIPEAVKRFCTWGPLLIPFYLPRGREWDYAWSTSEAMQAAGGGGIISRLLSLPLPQKILITILAIPVFMGISLGIRMLRRKGKKKEIKTYQIGNRNYRVFVNENGGIYSEADHHKQGVFPHEYDISRRSYDLMDPCGRILYIVDTFEWHKSKKRYWPVIGNFPQERFKHSHIEKDNDSITISNTNNGIRSKINITLPDEDSTAEIWEVTIQNLTHASRRIKVVPYLEWLLNGGVHDRFHTQYARLFPETEYISSVNALLSWQKSSKAMGIFAIDIPPEGILTSRMDFIGRAQSIWKPRVLETLDFMDARDTAPYPTFDPIGSLLIDATLNPKASKTIRFIIGYTKNKKEAIKLIDKHLKPRIVNSNPPPEKKKKSVLIGHGEILPGTPQPYSEFVDNGNKLLVYTPFTPRPYDHAMCNALEHSVMVTNRGLHTSCNGNSQQNRLTPDWPDTVTEELPSEAIYLYDVDKHEWYSPAYHPLNDPEAKNISEFGVDGTAVFKMTHRNISTEMTVFVPPTEPTGVYLLKIKNNSDHKRRMRVAPYFRMVLEFQPEKSGSLQKIYDKKLDAMFFSNPRNMFRKGWAFVSMSLPSDLIETKRGKFFGKGRGIARPFLVEKGRPDNTNLSDDKQIAAFLGNIEIPAHEERTIAFVLGQTDERKQAIEIVKKYKNINAARQSLESTRKWWLNLMSTVEFKTNQPKFDNLQSWLKYQAIAERIWGRRGFYQTSGAYGFRDQLQDSVNMLFVDPALARKQIILNAAHQFLEGDVYHWFFTLTDGRTAFACRSHASDNPLWLAWAVVEYVNATSDHTILNEMTSYAWSEFPFADLPKNKSGWGHLYQRSTRADSIYRHCLKSIDLVLEKRLGKNGIPLIRTGDWNDGLDEIGSEGKGESIWLGFFLYYILKDMVNIVEKKEGLERKEHYLKKMDKLAAALEGTWREDRYLRAFHDDGTEIGIKDSGVWEIDALTAAWAVMAGINQERARTVFHTALDILEKDNAVLLGWPALREDTKPYLGRSSKYPEGVRENGMYCHGVQWLIRASRILAERFKKEGDSAKANEYREICYRLWLKITPVSHVTPDQIEIYGGQPNKQPADILTNFDRGRMIWNGYTGAAGWLFRQAMESVIGASLSENKLVLPDDLDQARGELKINRVVRDLGKSPLRRK